MGPLCWGCRYYYRQGGGGRVRGDVSGAGAEERVRESLVLDCLAGRELASVLIKHTHMSIHGI